MNRETIVRNRLAEKPLGSVLKTGVLKNEVQGVTIEYISIKGKYNFEELSQTDTFDVLLNICGEGALQSGATVFEIKSETIVRIPYSTGYVIQVEEGKEFSFIRIRKLLDEKDTQAVKRKTGNFDRLYIKALVDCPAYKEDIKSDKTLNRMILPDGLVPRFAMGSVETEGPDEVGEHEHPMLDQIFFGLEGCRCRCFADGESIVLTENMMLHIPLGAKHSVSVEAGDKLAYIWMDFFLTMEGEKYMGEQHQIIEGQDNN
ncbi:hypothetical protein D1164_14000 [Mariniphaga sediminis]|uniref:Cupin domain-containing protein n=1 Tax=Mariniphaga sediminis TaxID=1628158 RepID=A0A399CZV4_9BACT|nr:hypothetical protein [Mariniphaga sediminis]RIH64468.1 hypothetical protein D1164_14000 [Mariniphaga sediminis]